MSCVSSVRSLRSALGRGVAALALFAMAAQAGAQQAKSAQVNPNLAEAEALLQQGLVEQAKAKVLQQLVQEPASVEGYNLLGIIYSSEKDYPDALDSFQHALKISPHSLKTRNNLANFYIAEGKPDLAEKEFQSILAAAPVNPE